MEEIFDFIIRVSDSRNEAFLANSPEKALIIAEGIFPNQTFQIVRIQSLGPDPLRSGKLLFVPFSLHIPGL